MLKPTMTLREVYDDLRRYGFKISLTKLANGIGTGLYPFGHVIQTGETGKRTFQILRADYESWKDRFVLFKNEADRTTAEPVPVLNTEWELLSTRTYTQEDKDIMWEVIIRSWTKKQNNAD